MSLTQKHTHLFPFPNPNPKNLPPGSKPFDEALIRRLSSLPRSSSPPSVPLSFLVSAVDLLSSTLASFSSLLSDPTLSSRSEPDVAALASHLDFSVSLLDAVNTLSSLIDRLSRRRLHLSLALHLLSHRPDLACTARANASEWGKGRRGSSAPRLALGGAPSGKISAVQRGIYAVEAVSALVIGAAFSLLGAETDVERVRVSEDFAWSAAYDGVSAAVKVGDVGLAAEIESVDVAVKELTAAVDGDAAGLGLAVGEAERSTQELTAGLDRLRGAVDGLFSAALNARNAALWGFRIGPNKCK